MAQPWAQSYESPDAVHRFADHLIDRLNAGKPCRGADIVATVRAARRHGLLDVVVRLAAVAWRAGPPGDDRSWWRPLAEVGEDAAIAAGDAGGLVELLRLSGAAYARAGESHVADRQWRRAFALSERLGDREGSAELLRSVGDLRRATGSFGRALTVFHELVGLREEQGDLMGLAEALAEVSTTMIEAGRRADARHFLQRAHEVLPPARGPRHARTLVALGRCWDRLGEPASAMPLYSQALAELIDVDDGAAAQARELLAAAASARAAATRGNGSAERPSTG